MRIEDLMDAGSSILGAVSDAVDTGDYSNLAWDIQDIVLGEKTQKGTACGSAAGQEYKAQEKQKKPVKYYFTVNAPDGRKSQRKRSLGRIGVIGFSAAILFSLLFFGTASMAGLRPSLMGMLIFAFFVLMDVYCLIISYKAGKEKKLIDRFYAYARAIGTKEYFSIEEVAGASGQKPGQVKKDMETFRENGMVPYLAMDESKTTVMLTHRMYTEYQKAEEARRAREEEERQKAKREEEQRQEAAREEKKAAKKRGKTQTSRQEKDEISDLIREGNEAIRTIREINDRIPDDYEMSNKLYRLENIMKGIFEKIKKEPDRAKDIRKLMNYYLPTTIKLLKAYEELCASPGGKENVEETKHQIENAMDTINDAFENLLDDLFQEQAWDIASDINVMKTMMAQDGLVDEPGKKEKVN